METRQAKPAQLVGERIRLWRTLRGISLGSLSARAGVSKSTLSRWEMGKQLPYAPQLTATLEALRVPTKERDFFWAQIACPRAIAQLKSENHPGGNEILRALRLRADIAQSEVATRLGISRASLARWENGSAWPTDEQLQQLCCLLEASREEIEFLAKRQFRETPLLLQREALYEAYQHLVYHDHAPDRDLMYLALGGRFVELYRRGEPVQSELAEVWGAHAYYLCTFLQEYERAERFAQQAIKLFQNNQFRLHNGHVRAFVTLAEITSYRVGPHAAAECLQGWLPALSNPYHRSWFHSLIARHWVGMGIRDAALVLAREAAEGAFGSETEYFLRQSDRMDLLIEQRQFAETFRLLPDLIPPRTPDFTTRHDLLRARLLIEVGQPTEAVAFLSAAATNIEKHGLHCYHVQRLRALQQQQVAL
jgi:transcriptional regulator with XRE-family HTH domain